VFCRELFDNASPVMWRTVIESKLVSGYMGVARGGADFFEGLMKSNKSEHGRGTLCSRYPETDWGQTSITAGTHHPIAPGTPAS
jgi:hypothetical protein